MDWDDYENVGESDTVLLAWKIVSTDGVTVFETDVQITGATFRKMIAAVAK